MLTTHVMVNILARNSNIAYSGAGRILRTIAMSVVQMNLLKDIVRQ